MLFKGLLHVESPRSRCARYGHAQGGAMVATRIDVDASAVSLHDLMDDIQTEAKSLGAPRRALPATERIEQVLDDLDRSGDGAYGGHLRDPLGVDLSPAVAGATRIDESL